MTSAHPEDRLVSCFYSIPCARVGAVFQNKQDRRRDVVRPLLQPPLLKHSRVVPFYKEKPKVNCCTPIIHQYWVPGVIAGGRERKNDVAANRDSEEETLTPPHGHVGRVRVNTIDVNESGWHGPPSRRSARALSNV